jgi:hypothetical protein
MLKDVVHIVTTVLEHSITISSSILMNVARYVNIPSCISLYSAKEENRYTLIKHKIANEDFKIILYKLINVVVNSFVHTEKAMRFSFVKCLCFSAYNYSLPLPLDIYFSPCLPVWKIHVWMHYVPRSYRQQQK